MVLDVVRVARHAGDRGERRLGIDQAAAVERRAASVTQRGEVPAGERLAPAEGLIHDRYEIGQVSVLVGVRRVPHYPGDVASGPEKLIELPPGLHGQDRARGAQPGLLRLARP
jgi:hypothetical protein